jgi:endonuclease/exonuclease/phosphatase family metal-dependent hydrolase
VGAEVQPVMRPLRFMSFNIRFDTSLDAEAGNRWPDRLDSVVETIRRERPEILGLQEALKSQLTDLTAALPDYGVVGKPRDVDETAEYVPLFIDVRRFALEENGDFWLSPTPEIAGSRGWDTDVARHCTWAKLRDHSSDFRFAVFNTHLDVSGAVARFEAAKVIVAIVASPPRLPSVVLGDFNAEEDSDPIAVLRAAGFRDTFRDLYPRTTDIQTIHHYAHLSGSKKIDYIMCDGWWRVLEARIIREPAAGRLPSDHFPVTANLTPAGTLR